MHRCGLSGVLVLVLLSAADAAGPPPFPYVRARAYHILPETHNNESGYFSLCEGRNGKIYVGTTRYGENSFLVEFDPAKETQRIVLDTHKVCGVTASGFAAQAKIHTPNFVGASGTIYVGSKQGYPQEGDTQEFPGGYVMTYSPSEDKPRCLGMAKPGYGVGDVVADESRELLYVVAERVTPDQPMHWMLGKLQGGDYRELGPQPTPYATTLVDRRGRASILDGQFRLVQYDPKTDGVSARDILLDGKPFRPADRNSIPTWKLADDGQTAWLILMDDPTLISIDLEGAGETVAARSHGRLIDGTAPDCRCGLDIGPKGRIYAVVRVNNDTGFGTGYLHHLLQFDPSTGQKRDLGVLAVENPDFFDFGPGPDGKPKPWTHGFHRLPDGTLTPLHHHMALIAARDGTVYVTILYPFTLLRIRS
ncbi:MAG: hypothetical protein KY476_07020 [Planctomycetes bacterium]|nr:hypothetical protein [Planctomycetota bacterium]